MKFLSATGDFWIFVYQLLKFNAVVPLVILTFLDFAALIVLRRKIPASAAWKKKWIKRFFKEINTQKKKFTNKGVEY